jgi:hypothetical protein
VASWLATVVTTAAAAASAPTRLRAASRTVATPTPCARAGHHAGWMCGVSQATQQTTARGEGHGDG